MNATDYQGQWTKHASAVARRINLGWWWEKAGLLGAASLLGLAVILLCIRTVGSADFAPDGVIWPIVAVLAISGTVGWLLSKSRFIGVGEGFVRLDERLRMRNRLTSAAQGVGPWPEFSQPDSSKIGLRWNWPMAVVPLLIALAVVAAAVFVPIPERESTDPLAVNEPRPWEEMQDWLATLGEEEVIDEASLEEFEEKIEELRNQPEEEWFSHASMEATDTLKDGFGRDIRDVADAMEAMDRNLGVLKNYSAELSEGSRDRLLQEFQDALDQLGNSGLEMNQALREKLAGIDPSQLAEGTLSEKSASDLEALRKQLGEASEKLGSMEGLPPCEECNSIATATGMQQPGQGAVKRGRGDAPMFYGDEDDLGTENLEDVKNTDLSRAALGEVIGVGETEREIDETPVGPVAGGGVSSTGKGGEAVWRDDALLPEEKALLKRYFK